MPLFSNKNDGHNNMIPPLPITMVVIPNELKVHVFEFKVHMNRMERDAIGYKTEGLMNSSQEGQQQEMVFIVLKEFPKRTSHFSFNDPIRFFQQVFHMKIPVRHGDTTKFGNKGLFNSSAILYVNIPKEVGIFHGCLATILLLNSHEVTTLSFIGHMRLLSFMGHQHSFYPYPYWSDLQRSPLDFKENIGTLAAFDGRCSLPPTSTLTHCQDRNKFVLRMHKEGSSFPVEQVPRIDKSIVLLPGCIDESAFGCYVHVPGKQHLNAIIPSNNVTEQNNNNMACCFVVLVGGHPRNAIRRLEDGFSLFLTEDTWTIFWHYLNKQMHFSLIEEGISFLLQWV